MSPYFCRGIAGKTTANPSSHRPKPQAPEKFKHSVGLPSCAYSSNTLSVKELEREIKRERERDLET
jgi:hypothetical protein